MKLTKEGIKSYERSAKGYDLPKFDFDKVQKATKEDPFWIHFGAGNIFRAFQANEIRKRAHV